MSKNMNQNMMSNMLNMMNNPEVMAKMGDLMKTPKMQELVSNPDLMNSVMDIFGMPSNEQPKLKFQPFDNATLEGLTNEKYNGQSVTIVEFNDKKNRYIVELEDKSQIMIKEENLVGQIIEAEVDTVEGNEEEVVEDEPILDEIN